MIAHPAANGQDRRVEERARAIVITAAPRV